MTGKPNNPETKLVNVFSNRDKKQMLQTLHWTKIVKVRERRLLLGDKAGTLVNEHQGVLTLLNCIVKQWPVSKILYGCNHIVLSITGGQTAALRKPKCDLRLPGKQIHILSSVAQRSSGEKKYKIKDSLRSGSLVSPYVYRTNRIKGTRICRVRMNRFMNKFLMPIKRGKMNWKKLPPPLFTKAIHFKLIVFCLFFVFAFRICSFSSGRSCYKSIRPL